jgi:hypothetical protein
MDYVPGVVAASHHRHRSAGKLAERPSDADPCGTSDSHGCSIRCDCHCSGGCPYRILSEPRRGHHQRRRRGFRRHGHGSGPHPRLSGAGDHRCSGCSGYWRGLSLAWAFLPAITSITTTRPSRTPRRRSSPPLTRQRRRLGLLLVATSSATSTRQRTAGPLAERAAGLPAAVVAAVAGPSHDRAHFRRRVVQRHLQPARGASGAWR